MQAPPISRNTLTNASFEENETQYTLSLPPYYAEVLKTVEPDLFSKLTPTPPSGAIQFMETFHLTKPAPDEAKEIEKFIKIYKNIVILAINKHLTEHFADELNSCTALQYSRDFETRERTYFGKLFNKAKYNRHEPSTRGLISGLSLIIKQLPYTTHLEDVFISYVPPYVGKEFYLPKILAHAVAAEVNNSEGKLKCHVLDCSLGVDKPEFKTLPIAEKFEKWQELYKNQVSFSYPENQHGLPTIVIEDNYQSGTTLWSYAKHLKSLGCPEVHGLCCVKLLRDTDNMVREA